MNQLNISGYSTALFSTFYFVEELGILFDAGDGVMSNLLQKSRKVKHVFVSHADRDHLAGLLQFMQLNKRKEFPKVYYPKSSKSFPYLEEFSAKFDPHISGGEWIGLEKEAEIWIKKDVLVKVQENNHIIPKPGEVKSLSFHVFRVKRKLREEFKHLSGKEIGTLRKEKGEDALTYEIRENIMSYSGDTPVENDGRWGQSNVLIHEATFIRPDDANIADPRFHKHSNLEEVIEMVSNTNVKHLILGHFSSRYSSEEIVDKVETLCKKYKINIPVKLVLPGQFVKNILNS